MLSVEGRESRVEGPELRVGGWDWRWVIPRARLARGVRPRRSTTRTATRPRSSAESVTTPPERCEDRVLDGLASGEKGSKGEPSRYRNYRPELTVWKQCQYEYEQLVRTKQRATHPRSSTAPVLKTRHRAALIQHTGQSCIKTNGQRQKGL